MELHRRGLPVAAPDGQDERPAVQVPVGPLEDPGLSLDPEPVRLLDVLAARGEDVEDEEPVGLEERSRRRERAGLLGVARHVQQRAERDRHERDSLRDRWGPQVADPELDPLGDAFALGVLPRDGQHAGRLVDADHLDARLRGRHRDPPGADGELDDRSARGERLVDIEAHVLPHGDGPRIVDPGDRVVESASDPVRRVGRAHRPIQAAL